MLKHLTIAAFAAALSLGSAIAVSAETIKLRATANSNENDEDYDGLVVFKNYVEQASNGAIEVELFIGTQLCSNGSECLAGIADGNIDIVIQTSGGTANIFPFVQVLDLPYLMSDDRVAEAVLANGSSFVQTMQDMVAESSDGAVRLMTIGNTGGWRNFANTQRRALSYSREDGVRGYLRWRRDLQVRHAAHARAILEEAGYDEDAIARVERLIRKETPKKDPEGQAFEDGLTLVFLETQLHDLALRTDPETMAGVIQKTWSKISPAARDLALASDLAPEDRALIERALA